VTLTEEIIMSATGLEVFDRTLQATNIWLDDLMKEMGWQEPQRAYHALRVVLHALRDRLPVEEASHLSAQLPLLVRGIYFEGWHPAKVPVRERTQDQFLTHVTEAFLFDVDADSRQIASAVFIVLSRHVTEGEVKKIKSVLPEGIRELWP
jgi:uncharacterized protein (DUF2267 family)